MKAAASGAALTIYKTLNAEQGKMRPERCELGAFRRLARPVQYSSASITVSTRVVTSGLAGSGDISSISLS